MLCLCLRSTAKLAQRSTAPGQVALGRSWFRAQTPSITRETQRVRCSHSQAQNANNKHVVPPSMEPIKFVLWDSLSQSMKEVATRNGTNTKALAWYTCGPTTYSAMHLGHARTYVWLDMMRRVLEFVAKAQGTLPPLFVMNVTDIDDKILAASAETKQQANTNLHQSPMMISRQAEANFWKDMDRLGCQRPHMTTRVTEFVESDIIPYIERLVQQEMAYPTNDGVYFDVPTFEAKMGSSSKYGKLAGAAIKSATTAATSNPSLDVAATSDHGSEKRDRRDFALWKFRKPGEDVFWESPWGEGRPGWHIECSAMIEAIQQRVSETHQFLVHAGGWDLKFPHHTNEIAQAEAYHYDMSSTCYPCSSTGASKEWIPHWVHTGHLMIKQSKMSKSLKNFLTVDELWFDYDPLNSSQLDSPADDFRLWCLMGGSYSQREEYSRSKLLGARRNRERILRFLLDGERWVDQCRQLSLPSTNADEVISSTTRDKRWSDEDHLLFDTVNQASTDSYRALLNNMHGVRYVEGLVLVAETGSAYIRRNEACNGANTEPIKSALKAIRDLLGLVGFSDSTVRAGLQQQPPTNATDTITTATAANYVVGGETALLDELARFRAAIRMAALDDIKSKKGSENIKTILKECDDLRDNLPKVGVELMDGKKGLSSSWRFCVPKTPDTES